MHAFVTASRAGGNQVPVVDEWIKWTVSTAEFMEAMLHLKRLENHNPVAGPKISHLESPTSHSENGAQFKQISPTVSFILYFIRFPEENKYNLIIGNINNKFTHGGGKQPGSFSQVSE